MDKKPTYEELVQRVKELEKGAVELKQAQEALRSSEEKCRSLVDNAPIPIIVVDRDGIIQYINHTVPGLEVEKVIGTSHYDYAPPEYHGVMKESIEQVFKTGQVASYEIAGLYPIGSTSLYITQLGPIKRNGQVVAVSIMPRDITKCVRAEEALQKALDELETRIEERTAELIKANEQLKGEIEERKRAEEALQESEDRLRMLFEYMNSGVAVYAAVNNGEDFVLKDFNRAGEVIDNVTLVPKRI